MDGLGKRLAAGERAAFAELYDRCAPGLHRYLAVLAGSSSDADDLLQETFVRLTKSRATLSTVENLEAYVFATARNEYFRQASRLLRQRDREHPFHGDELSVQDPNSRSMEQGGDLFGDFLMSLKPTEREVLVLKFQSGFTLREIAELTGTPPGTVATRFRDALAKLRQKLSRHFL